MSTSSAYRVRQVENILLEHQSERGYELIEIPIIEKADVFLTRAGDKIIDSLFTFEHRGQQMALRPEFTAAAARHYLETAAGKVVRWQFVGATFADDEGDKRDYQQHSIGAELIGQPGCEAEAEVMSIAATGAQKAGLQNWQVVSGHVGLQAHLLSRYGLDKRTIRLVLSQREALKNPALGVAFALEQIQRVATFVDGPEVNRAAGSAAPGTQHMLDVLLDSTRYGTTMGGRTREEIAARVLQKHQRALERHRITAALQFFAAWTDISASVETAFQHVGGFIGVNDSIGWRLFDNWRHTIDLCLKSGIPADRVIIQPNLARNWEYYTGVVFGICTVSGDFVAGGGRYDELIGLPGGVKNTPAVGFAYYVDRLLKEISG